jgi:hypothetical protein
MMRARTIPVFIILLAGLALAGPPEPPEPPKIPEDLDRMILLEELESLKSIDAAESLRLTIELDSLRSLGDLESERILAEIEALRKSQDLIRLPGFDSVLAKIDEGLVIKELTIGGDSIVIVLSNDSTFVFSDFETRPVRKTGEARVSIGNNIVIEEDEVIDGDVASLFGDVIVKGTVNGGVLTLSGDIYVTSTGYIREGAVAVNGNVKKDPGARVERITWKTNTVVISRLSERTPFRIMGSIFLLSFLIMVVLSATCASIFKVNVDRVVTEVKSNFLTSFLKGYLFYVLAFVALIVLTITVLGIPLAVLGVPLAFLAAIVLASTAVSNIVGQKTVPGSPEGENNELRFSNFLYGSLILGSVPGLFFLIQAVTGSLLVMIFNWIFIGMFLFIVIPAGLGGVLTTRFGTRSGKGSSMTRQTTSPEN